MSILHRFRDIAYLKFSKTLHDHSFAHLRAVHHPNANTSYVQQVQKLKSLALAIPGIIQGNYKF